MFTGRPRIVIVGTDLVPRIQIVKGPSQKPKTQNPEQESELDQPCGGGFSGPEPLDPLNGVAPCSITPRTMNPSLRFP
jgi:hypothetical protein